MSTVVGGLFGSMKGYRSRPIDEAEAKLNAANAALDQAMAEAARVVDTTQGLTARLRDIQQNLEALDLIEVIERVREAAQEAEEEESRP